MASVNVSAKLLITEKAALDRLVSSRAERLRAQGVSDDTFAGWLRQTIREQAAAAGFQVDEPTAAPSPAVEPVKPSAGKRPARK